MGEPGRILISLVAHTHCLNHRHNSCTVTGQLRRCESTARECYALAKVAIISGQVAPAVNLIAEGRLPIFPKGLLRQFVEDQPLHPACEKISIAFQEAIKVSRKGSEISVRSERRPHKRFVFPKSNVKKDGSGAFRVVRVFRG